LDFDVLYKEYEEMKTEKIGILSQYVRGNMLYISEKMGERVRISNREYDYEIVGFHNFPMSDPDVVLPADEDKLKFWTMGANAGYYTFTESEEETVSALSYVRMYNIKKDVFLFNNEIIVHVQDVDIEFESKKEETVVTSLLEYLGSIGGDKIEEILDRIIKENPGINKVDPK
jgi:hypothetical protein